MFQTTATFRTQAAESDILSFSSPYSFIEEFEVSEENFVSSNGSTREYSQYAAVKYWSGTDASTVKTGNGITFENSGESISVASVQPVYGSYIFEFDVTHPEFNNLKSAVYIGVRGTNQFTDMTGYSLSNMPTDGVWLGISYNNVGVGSRLVSGNNSVRFEIGSDFNNYTHFKVFDDRENNVIYYYAESSAESVLFAKSQLDFAESTTTINYTFYTDDGEKKYSTVIDSILVNHAETGVYPQLQLNNYLCTLGSFGITCEGDENALISEFSVEGAELSEEISLDVTGYTLKMPVSEKVTVSVKGSPGAKYKVFVDNDEVPMLSGKNSVSLAGKSALKIVSENGIEETVYTFKIIKNTHTVKLVPTFCTVEDADEDGTKTVVTDYDGTASFDVSPKPGYDFAYITGGAQYAENTVNTVRSGTVTLNNVTSDTEIELIFERREAIELTIGSATAACGETVDIPITISENSGAVAGSFNILYDSTRLEFLGSVTTGCLSLGNRNLEATDIPGKLGFYFISKNLGLTPLTSGGVLVYARFVVKDNAENGEGPIVLSFEGNANTKPSVDDWEGERLVKVNNGAITFLTENDGKYILKTAVADNIGGTVSPGTRLGEGEKFTIKATPATGYEFSHWEAEKGSFSDKSKASVTYTMGNESTTVYAHFKLKSYAISVSVKGGEGGTITPSETIVNYGGSVTVELCPQPGYEIEAFTVNGKDKLSALNNNKYTLSSIKSKQTMEVTFKWVGADIITDILPLRAYDAEFSNQNRTITVKASKKYTSAGFALNIYGDKTAYIAEKGKNLSRGVSGGKEYIVARRAAGNNQQFELCITCGGYEYIYNVTFMFTENEDSAGVIDLASTNAGKITLDTANYTAALAVDRYMYDYADFAFVLPEGADMSYEFAEPQSGAQALLISSTEYKTANGGSYGSLKFVRVSAKNGNTQNINVKVTNGGKTNNYTLSVRFRDLSYEGNVRPKALIPLRLSQYSIDTENKTIYAESNEGASSAGFSFEMDGGAPVKLTCLSGYGLAYGSKDGYRYIVGRRSRGTEQTYRVKLYGADGYEYSWYTVTMIYN